MRKFHLIFGFVLVLCSVLMGFTIRKTLADERLAMEQALLDECFAIKGVFDRLLLKAHALDAFVVQNNGNITDFRTIAADLLDSPVIANVLVAPGGVVADVYPLEGNENLPGYFLLGEGPGSAEARIAKDSNTPVIAGPFSREHGEGMAVVGILPVSLYLDGGGTTFWGIVSVTLKYPEVLRETRLHTLSGMGLAYTLWRIAPETGEQHIIAQSVKPPREGMPSANRRIRLVNEDWYLSVSRTQAWYEHTATWTMVVAALAVSLLAAHVVTGNDMARAMKEELEEIAHTDQLTGLLNRKGVFFELQKLIDRQERFCLSWLDLNHFKQINGTYGHIVGDYTLREFTERVRSRLGKDHLFARTGSAEFIIAYAGEPSGDTRLWQELEREFSRPVSPGSGEDFFLHFSRGDAVYPDDGHTLDELMVYADNVMREKKRQSYAMEKGRRAEDRGFSA